jgi:hypothetical protein
MGIYWFVLRFIRSNLFDYRRQRIQTGNIIYVFASYFLGAVLLLFSQKITTYNCLNGKSIRNEKYFFKLNCYRYNAN